VQSAPLSLLAKNQPDRVDVGGVVRPGGAIDRQRLAAATAQVLAHPGFDAACQQFALAVLHCYEHHRVVRRQMHDTARFALLCFLLMYESERLAGQGAGASAARLVDALSAHGMASRSRVKDLIDGLKLIGCVQGLPHPTDTRARVLRPTALLLQPLRAWLEGDLLAVDQVCALPAAPAVLCERPHLVPAYLGGLARALSIDGFSMIEGQPEIAQLLVRDCGYLVLMQVLAQWQGVPGGGPATAAVQAAVPEQAFSERFGVSRSHTRNLLRFGQQCGWWLPLAASGRAISVSAGFHGLMRRWMAQEFALMAALGGWCYTTGP
jgi:hypothetical protein